MSREVEAAGDVICSRSCGVMSCAVEVAGDVT